MEDIYPYPVARIGLIGGGQLGRMLVRAAKSLGCTCVVLDPVQGSPAGQLAGHQIVGEYSDPSRVRELAESCDVVTFELEDIDTETLLALESEGHRIYPRPALLATIQDKFSQKAFLRDAGIPTSDFVDMPQPDAEAFAAFGYPLVQKARRGGYDGRGVAVMPIFSFRDGDTSRHVIRMQPPLELESQDERGGDTTTLARNVARMNAAIEEAIRTAPDHWLWAHRRFKTRPEGEPSPYSPRRRRRMV